MITLVPQQCDKSCALACIAMITGNTFETVRSLTDHVPISDYKMDEILESLGHRVIRSMRGTLLPEKVMILDVPSLNRRGTMHSIVLDTHDGGFQVFDPNKGFKGETYESFEKIHGWGAVLWTIKR